MSFLFNYHSLLYEASDFECKLIPMARKITYLYDLDPDVQTAKIQVRVIRLWIVERNFNENHHNIEMLLVDRNVRILTLQF